MTFYATLERHLRAIANRDLKALESTLSPDRMVLITADGRLVRSTHEFLDMHREWFESPTWTMNAQPIEVQESPDLGIALLKLDYADQPEGKPPLHQTSYLTLVFVRRNGQWEMVQDQNTPCKNGFSRE